MQKEWRKDFEKLAYYTEHDELETVDEAVEEAAEEDVTATEETAMRLLIRLSQVKMRQ